MSLDWEYSLIMGWNSVNSKSAGNVCKAALLATMINLKKGLDTLLILKPDQPLTKIIFNKTPECRQILGILKALLIPSKLKLLYILEARLPNNSFMMKQK
jgi:hypothetical protein